MSTPDAPRRMRWLAFAVLIATFIVGALAGAATMRVVSAREPQAAESHGRRHHTSLLDQLDLTPAQRQHADSILSRRRKQMDAFWAKNGPELRAIVDSTRAEIRAILTPAQQAKEDSIRAARKAFYDRGGQSHSDGSRR